MKRTPLLPKPHKVREWKDRHRDSLARGQFDLADKPTLKRSAPKPAPKVPPEVKRAVRKRSGGRCIVCLFDGHGGKGAGKADELHHVWDKALWPSLATEPANLVGTCAKCHARHTNAFRRIPLGALPGCVFELYERLPVKAQAFFDRIYGEPEKA